MTPLFKKLNLANHQNILVLESPAEFEPELAKLDGVKVLRSASSKTRTPFAIGFAVNLSVLNRLTKTLVRSIEGDAILWIAYPKRSSRKYQCDFNRDSGWAALGQAGFEPVRQVAIDEDWSALRFRKAEHIKSLTRQAAMAISPEGKKRTKK